MLIFIVYDITSTPQGDRRRNRIVKILERAGLYRVQKSVFLGNLNNNEMDELSVIFQKMFEEAARKDKSAGDDKIYLFPVSKDDFANVRMIGKGFDKAFVADEIKALVI